MDQVLSSSDVSTDEEKESKLSLGIVIVQDAVEKLAQEVKRANKRVERLDKKYRDAEERATKWEKLYKELKKATEDKNQEESEDESKAEGDQKPAASTRAKRKRGAIKEESNKKSRGNSPNNNETSASEESDGEASNQESTEHFNALDEATQNWISTIGLESAYGSRNNGLTQINVDAYVGPASFEEIFFLTDYLFPVEEDEETHHWRLFKKESRPGIKVRQVLRNIKKKDPSNPMVCWHKRGGQWIPPTVQALTGIVKLIVDI